MRQLLFFFLTLLTHISYSQVVLDALPDQVIGREGVFEDVILSDFTTSDVFWQIEFISPEIQDVRPTWNVSSNDFQFEMNITAAVLSKNVRAIGDSHLLAVTDLAGNVRSVGSAIQVNDDWVYFLTVYSNSNEDELFFTFYDDSLSQLLKGNNSIDFNSNSILGQPDIPFIVPVGNISFDFQDSLLSFNIEDSKFVGSEKLLVTARSLSNPNDLAKDTITLTVKDDYTPLIQNIPNQIVNYEVDFTSFDLDDFVLLQDNDEVFFSFIGSVDLQITIDEINLVTVSKPTNWSGTESIKFVVIDQTSNGFSSFQEVIFLGKPEDQAPIISPIEDRNTGIGGFFEPILLSDYVEASNPGAVKWELEFLTDSAVVLPDWSVNANEFQFSMSLTAEVAALGKNLKGEGHKLAAFSAVENKVVGITEAIDVNGDWFFFLTINSNIDKDSIYFEVYDIESSRVLPTEAHVFFQANDVLGDPLDPFIIKAGYIIPELNHNVLSFTLRQALWNGVEIMKLTATDTATAEQLNHSDTIIFQVLDIKPPILELIPNQEIQEGSSFASIDLSEYLKNVTIDEVLFEVFDADTLKPVLDNAILSFTIEDPDFFGDETVTIKVTSLANQELVDVIEVSLIVSNVNDSPVITTLPPVNAAIDELYYYNLLVTDADFDEIDITVNDLPTWMYFVPSNTGVIILGVPSEADAGEYSAVIEVSDGQKIVQQQINFIVSSARIENLTSQVIDEGEAFETIDLDDFLNIAGDILTYWEVSGGNELTIDLDEENRISVLIPNDDWFGKEEFTIRLLDQSTNDILDEVLIAYEVQNINDAPEFLSNPSSEIEAENQLFVKTLVLDADGDQVSYSLEGAPIWITILTESNGFTLIGRPLLSAETYDFVVVANDGTTTSTLSVQFTVSYILSIEDEIGTVSLYPNPSNGILNIESSVPILSIIIIDNIGRELIRIPNSQKRIDVSHLDVGSYFLLIDGEKAIKFIKQ